MRGFTSSIAALALLSSTTQAKVLHLGVERRNHGHHSISRDHPNHSTGRGAPAAPILNEYRQFDAYFVNVTVGNPPQSVTLQLDTGSSDTWFPAVNACGGPCPVGSFDPTKSTTYHDAGFEFNITYGDGSFAIGEYLTDELVFDGIKLRNLTMALGTNTDIPYGILGISYPADEASSTSKEGPQYSNFVYTMQKEGIIDTVAFSLYLNDPDADEGGSIIFSGIDKEKYYGPLRRMKTLIFPGTKNITGAFMVPLTSLEIHKGKGNNATVKSEGYPYTIWLDSGSTFTTLPNEIAETFYSAAGAIYDPSSGNPNVPCALGQQNNKVVYRFGFGSPNPAIIEIDVAKLVYDPTHGYPGNFSDGPYKGQAQCILALDNSTTSPYYVFGESFLQHAYVVHDMVNNETAIAQAKPNAKGSNIVPFSCYGARIPESVPV